LYLESPILGLEEKSQSTFTARRFIVLKAADFIFKKSLILRFHFFEAAIHIAEKSGYNRCRHPQMRGFFG